MRYVRAFIKKVSLNELDPFPGPANTFAVVLLVNAGVVVASTHQTRTHRNHVRTRPDFIYSFTGQKHKNDNVHLIEITYGCAHVRFNNNIDYAFSFSNWKTGTRHADKAAMAAMPTPADAFIAYDCGYDFEMIELM